jgi:hypothetical protein
MKQIFRKELSRVVQGSREIVEYEYHAFEDFLTVEELRVLDDLLGDDTENAYYYGVAYDSDDEMTWIEVGKFLPWARDYLTDHKEDKDLHYCIVEKAAEKLEKYIGFDIWL